MQNALLKEVRDTFQVRRDFARGALNLKGAGLEFCVTDRPLFDPKIINLKFADYPGAGAVEIDYVLRETAFAKLIEERFDFVIAAHVIEHIPDITGWLQNAAEILKPGGRLFLIVPDKRFTFDALRPVTGIEDILLAHQLGRTCPTFDAVFENIYLYRMVDAQEVWDGTAKPGDLRGRFDIATALRLAFEYFERQDRNIHCHVFTSDAFVKIVDELSERGLVPLKRAAFQDVWNPCNEFFVVLEKPA